MVSTFSVDYHTMGLKVLEMVNISLDALVTEDVTLGRQLFLMDEDANALRNQAYKKVIAELQQEGGDAEALVNLYLISRHLERIGDRTNNIAEEII